MSCLSIFRFWSFCPWISLQILYNSSIIMFVLCACFHSFRRNLPIHSPYSLSAVSSMTIPSPWFALPFEPSHWIVWKVPPLKIFPAHPPSERQEHREVHGPAEHTEVLQEAGLLRDFVSCNHEQHGGIEVTHWQWGWFVAALLVLEKLATTSSTNSYSCRMCSIFRCLAWTSIWRTCWWRSSLFATATKWFSTKRARWKEGERDEA